MDLKLALMILVICVILVAGCKPKCPETSCDTGNCCRTVEGGIGVSGVITPAECKCPRDTEFASVDNTAPGGPYNICTCI
ncbi:MAG: hypothetical protein QXR48_04875 [Candidatus Woesearchaeota archaeon]